jgi:hypothetical protein
MANVGSAADFQAITSGAAIIGPIIGQKIVSDTIFVIGSTTMAVGGLVAFVLDTTVEGTRKSRGLSDWENLAEDDSEFVTFVERIQSGD